MKINHCKTLYLYISLIALLAIGLIFSIMLGSSNISLSGLLKGLFLKDNYKTESIIVYNLRLPRALGAMIAGMGLAVSGAILQTVTNNGLAGPNIIGVNAGAGFGVVLVSVFLPFNFYLTPVAAFFGAFLTTLLIGAVAIKMNGQKSTVILAGIAITAILNAFISLFMLLDDDLPINYRYFSIGGLNGVTIEKIIFPFFVVVIAIALSLIFSSKIDALNLNDTTAVSIGVNVKLVRFIAILIASLCASAAVSFAGLLGFVGLAVPHIAKKLVGLKTIRLVPISALIGATLLVYADLLSRIILPKTEIPLGIITAFLGAPFFVALLLRGNKNAWV